MQVPAAIYDRIIQAAETHSVDPAIVAAVVYQESGFRTDEVVGDAGESFGSMQLHLRGAGAGCSIHALLDAAFNIDRGTAYLARWLKAYPNNLGRAISAYNWPAWALDHHEPSGYGQAVLRHLAQIENEGLRRHPESADGTPSLLELIDTIWGALERAGGALPKRERVQAVAGGQAHLILLKERLGLDEGHSDLSNWGSSSTI